MCAQATPVKGRCTHRTPASGSIGRATVEVGDAIAIDEFQGGFVAEEAHHVGGLRQIGARAVLVELRAQLMPQIRQGHRDVFLQAGGQRQRVARHPHPAARPGGGAADLGVFFCQDHLQAEVRCGHRRGQTTGTRPQHQQITIQGRRGSLVHGSGGVNGLQ